MASADNPVDGGGKAKRREGRILCRFVRWSGVADNGTKERGGGRLLGDAHSVWGGQWAQVGVDQTCEHLFGARRGFRRRAEEVGPRS